MIYTMFKKLSFSLVIAASIVVIQLPTMANAVAADEAPREKRKTRLMGPKIGKKVAAAFELYNNDDIKGTLALLLEIDADKDFDKAMLNRYIAVMYATLGDNEKKAIKYLQLATAPDILNAQDHGEALKLLGDLQMQIEQYQEALTAYEQWMTFTGDSDANVWTKIANANFAMKRWNKVIYPSDQAISAYGDKHNKNPYILKMTAYYEQKDYKKAVGVLETAVQLFPKEKKFWTQLPMFYLLIEDYAKALQTLELAYKMGYLTTESQIKTLANLYAQNDIPHQAAVLLEKHIASGLVKRDDTNIATLANAWHQASHIDKAAKYYGDLAKMTNEAKHYNKQGMLLKQDEQFKKAIVALNKALDLGVSNSGRLHMSIAESHFYLEQYKQAYAAIQKASKDPQTRKAARGWVSFIKETAKRKKVSI